MFANVRRLYATLIFLRWEQVWFRFFYKVRDTLRRVLGLKYPLSVRSIKPQKPLHFELFIYPVPTWTNQSFTFLNLRHRFEGAIDWNYLEHGKLWAYNLNYFEFLLQKEGSKAEKLELIFDFIRQLPNSKEGLEPYPISCRAIAWIKFLALHAIEEDVINQSLYAQLSILTQKLEYHLLGNHLLENGFALLFGAYFFQDNRFYTTAKRILQSELEEQVLADGGHFELSPMYHQLMLYRVLDCYHLVKNNPFFNQALLPLLKEKAEKMLGWLQEMTFSNGDIPLLNDSAFQVNPTTSELTNYAKELGISPQILPLQASGYRKIKKGNYEIIVDIGKIGPDYIPGHAHSDTFNFVLYVKGRPFILDTGTSTYDTGQTRQRERSTAAHNTVMVEGKEQSEVWGGFRVGQRAFPTILEESVDKIVASHDGYQPIGIFHKRTFLFEENKIQIIDELLGKPAPAQAFLHFAPSVSLHQKGDFHLETEGIKMSVEGDNARLEMQTYQAALEFNRTQKAQKIKIDFSKKLIITFEL